MKMRCIAVIMLTVMVLWGCAVSEEVKDTGKKASDVTTLINELTEKSRNEGELSLNEVGLSEATPGEVPSNEALLGDVTHLKVSEFKDYAPFYSISFQKIEGKTGNVLLFEGSTDGEDPQTMIPDNIKVEPESAVWELSYSFDGDANLADTVTLQFWNRGNAGSFMIEIDGLQYELKPPATEPEMVTLNQTVKPLDITIQYVLKYSNALLFELEGVEKIEFAFLLTDENGSKIAPTRVAYTAEEERIQLLYVFENLIGDETWTMNIKDLLDQSEDQAEYVECNLTF